MGGELAFAINTHDDSRKAEASVAGKCSSVTREDATMTKIPSAFRLTPRHEPFGQHRQSTNHSRRYLRERSRLHVRELAA